MVVIWAAAVKQDRKLWIKGQSCACSYNLWVPFHNCIEKKNHVLDLINFGAFFIGPKVGI